MEVEVNAIELAFCTVYYTCAESEAFYAIDVNKWPPQWARDMKVKDLVLERVEELTPKHQKMVSKSHIRL